MNRIALTLALSLLLTSVIAQTSLQSPEQFLGYELGDRFTRHHRVIEYFQNVTAARPNNVKFIQYGETYEHRPLVVAIIASDENFKKLEQIRLDNLKRTGFEQGAPATNVALVWLSYNVHGNEANSTEASMKTIYDLANPSNTKTQAWLKNTIVIIDPCINPDGRDRYANFYNQYGNQPADPSPDAREHREPWPGGRANHYLFDLNRDWAWQSQIESQNRIKLYNQWMPHVHVDFHEMGYNSPYFFAPAADPLHDVISSWQREFLGKVGKNNAKHFDENGWLYFTKERYDLFYPSYGDTYPTYSGAIGMTYEQGGGGFGGLTITTKEGDPMTLKDRLTHHYTNGLSTVEVTSINAAKVTEEFEKYFKENLTNPASAFKTYVIKADNNTDKINRLTAWLDTHRIQYGHPSSGKSSRGFDFKTQSTTSATIGTDDIIINIYQPKGRFVTTLFEPQSNLTDSITYDITAWNLMYAYGLSGYALMERINVAKPYERKGIDNSSLQSKPYAYLFNYGSLEDVKFLATLLKDDIKVRVSEKSFSVGGNNFERGTLIVTRRNNESKRDFDEVILSHAKKHGRKIYTTSTGLVDRGKDLGSGSVNYLKAPKIGLIGGEQTSSLGFGEVWHFFERQLNYPITILGTDYFKSISLEKYDVLIIPPGNYRMFDEDQLNKISEWVSAGGQLIVTAQALNSFTDKKGFGLKKYASEDAKKAAEKEEEALKKENQLVKYDEAERKNISNSISGAIYKVNLDTSHPLTFGLGDSYFTLRTSSSRYDYLQDGWNVGTLRGKVKPLMGFAGYHANKQLENTLVFGVEDKGRGHIVYFVDNPMFRSFWENGKMVFSNAVFLVGGQ
jgi:hypothetical protein